MCFGQPTSFAMDVVSALRRKFRRIFARPQDHDIRVQNVQNQVTLGLPTGSEMK